MLFKAIDTLRNFIDKEPSYSKGLVPTMGALHNGHLSLIKKAQQDCEIVVVSIFVNPTQFNDPNDLSNYPRTLNTDVKKIEALSKNILIYSPTVEEIYPEEPKSESFNFESLSKYMEGQYRSGHFNGVGTVLNRLFDLVEPHKAYFGEKDYQQLAIVKKLVNLTGQNVEIIGCKTFREPNGLAKSSRNKLLSEHEKDDAKIIYECLKFAKQNFNYHNIEQLKKKVKSVFKSTNNLKLEYFEIADEDDLIPTSTARKDKKYRAFIAAYCNKVRLIDNIALN